MGHCCCSWPFLFASLCLCVLSLRWRSNKAGTPDVCMYEQGEGGVKEEEEQEQDDSKREERAGLSSSGRWARQTDPRLGMTRGPGVFYARVVPIIQRSKADDASSMYIRAYVRTGGEGAHYISPCSLSCCGLPSVCNLVRAPLSPSLSPSPALFLCAPHLLLRPSPCYLSQARRLSPPMSAQVGDLLKWEGEKRHICRGVRTGASKVGVIAAAASPARGHGTPKTKARSQKA